MFKIGYGFDVHTLEEGRAFWLGGIRLESTFGPKGHSDADVLIHAICDALLGSLALGDIGFHFSDQDARWKDVDSKILLKEVCRMVREKGYEIGNIDSTVILEKPKIMPYVPSMRECLAQVMEIDIECVSVKATTNEKMGYVGRGEGIQAQAVALVYIP